MAVANTKSTLVTNADATPRVPNNAYLDAGMLRESIGTLEVAAADDDGSVYRMVRLPSGARVSQILIANDAITSGTAYDIGLYQTAANGGAAADDDLFASALDLSSANAQLTAKGFESASRDIANIASRLWELLSLTVDPFLEYDVCLTGDTVGSSAGSITLCVRWVM